MQSVTIITNPQNGMSYSLYQKIGEGAFGEVWHGRTIFNHKCAIKLLKSKNGHSDYQSWANEVNIASQCRNHPHITTMYDCFIDNQNAQYVIVMELAKGNLERLLTVPYPLPHKVIQNIGLQILRALHHLHNLQNTIIHRDVSLRNILEFPGQKYKLADFGISRESTNQQFVIGRTGLRNILPPELMSRGYSSKQSDIYQLGLVLLSLLIKRHPIDLAIPSDQRCQMINNGVPRELAEQHIQSHGRLADVISKMLRRREEYRYHTAEETIQELTSCC